MQRKHYRLNAAYFLLDLHKMHYFRTTQWLLGDPCLIQVKPFEQQPERYDAWFNSENGRRIFPIEVECLKKLLSEGAKPQLEIGVGTGRFASALNIGYGVDPSRKVLGYAKARGVNVKHGFAENLPYKDQSFGAVFMIVTVCFLTDPGKAFKEASRVLTSDGEFIVGLVPRESAWGKMYADKAKEGHPFYSPAVFYSPREIIDMAETADFSINDTYSCLFEEPDSDLKELQPPQPGICREAGFVGMRFYLAGNT